MTAPLHTATINGQEVRFFRSPLPGEDLPWHAVDDFGRAAGLPPQALAGMQTRFPEMCRMIQVDDKPVRIACHSAGQGMSAACDHASGHSGETGPLFAAYCHAVKDATDVMNAQDGLTPMEGISRTMRIVSRGEAGHVH